MGGIYFGNLGTSTSSTRLTNMSIRSIFLSDYNLILVVLLLPLLSAFCLYCFQRVRIFKNTREEYQSADSAPKGTADRFRPNNCLGQHLQHRIRYQPQKYFRDRSTQYCLWCCYGMPSNYRRSMRWSQERRTSFVSARRSLRYYVYPSFSHCSCSSVGPSSA